MRPVLTLSEDQMEDWRAICKEFCRQKKMKLLFVNNTSFGAESSNGVFVHLYVDELEGVLKQCQNL